ncbi:MAG: tetratricopeptide repeat protein [Bryobacterales bacterium]|nr:tetratricopeptide repeat protein [Bryobacterales bacterium]
MLNHRVFRIVAIAAAIALPALPQNPQPKPADKASSYYNFSMGHLYAELAGAYGNRGEYLNQAIDHYRSALKADPTATFIAEELSDLYVQAGRLREAVTDNEAAVRDNPNDLNARRILGRIYTRLVGDTQQGKVNENMLQKAIEQYTKIVSSDARDLDSWMTLGRLYKVANNSVEAEKSFRKALDIEPENEEAMTGLAMVYSDLGDNKRATELLQKVAEKSPNLRTLTSLAGAYEQMRDYSLAAETLKKAMTLAPDNANLRRALAENLLRSERYDDALKIYEDLVADEPKDVESLLRVSQIYRQQRKFDKAREASDKAKKLAPDSVEIVYNEVGLYEAEGKTEEAIQALKSVVDQTAKRTYSAAEKNSRAMLLERLGLLYRQNEQYEEANQTFRELGNLDASMAARAAAQVVDTLRQARDYKKAEDEAEAAAKKWPEDRTLRVVRANLLADVGKTNEAVAEIKKTFDGKNDREGHLTLAQIYEKGKNYTEMAKEVDAAEKLSTTNEEKEAIYFMRGAMLEKQKKHEASEAEFKKLLAMNPNSASALNYLGYMLADRNVRVPEALDMIRKAVEQEPMNGAYLDSLGWAYFRMGKLEEAEKYLKQAIEKTSKDPTVHDHLGDVYAKRGNLKEAVTQWEISLKLWQVSSPSEQDPQEVAKVQKKLESGRVKLAKEQAGKR